MSNKSNRQGESLSEIKALRARVADLERAEAKQEKTAAELRESLERFQLAAHGTLDGLWDWHVATGNVWWSPRYRELIGYEDDELPANYNSWESLLHPDDRERTLKAVHRHIEDGRDYDIEYRLRTKSIGYRWFLARGVVKKDETGQPIRMAGSIRDITVRKQGEEALRENEARLQATIESLPFDFFAIDANSRYVLQNEVCKERWGELVGKRPEDVVNNEDALAIWLSNNRRAMAGETVRGEVEFTAKGETRVYHNIVAPIRHSDQVLGVLGINIDITERKEMEKALQKSHDELEHRLEERTATLGELARAQRVSTTGALATELAHELNQPLAAISSYAAGCLRRMQSDAQTSCTLRMPLEMIAKHALQAGEIIRHIRAFVSTPASEPAIFNINDLIGEVVEFMRYATRGRQVGVEIDPGTSIPLLHADKVRIEQVVVNLVVNAIEALDRAAARDGRVHIQTTRNQRDEIEVAVSDNGPGIPPKLADRIFEPLFTTREAGMGMGLAISRSIVEEHGGRLWVTPNRDHGVTFRFTLPKSITTDS